VENRDFFIPLQLTPSLEVSPSEYCRVWYVAYEMAQLSVTLNDP